MASSVSLFGFQFLDADRMTYGGKRRDANFWIENASVEWNEAEAPFHTVARLTLLSKSQLPLNASEATYFSGNRRFNYILIKCGPGRIFSVCSRVRVTSKPRLHLMGMVGVQTRSFT